MKHFFSALALSGLVVTSSVSFAGETYESQEARLKITFPGEYEVEKEVADESGMTTFSLSCTYGDMILIGNVFIYEEAISEEDNLYSEDAEVLRICQNFYSKFDAKYISDWSVDGDTGVQTALKCKKDWKGYIGRYYTIIQEQYEWQFLILGSKKTYDLNVESKFINSFEILD